MSTGWEDHETAPLEYFHARLMDAFHDLRNKKGDNAAKTLTLDGIEMSNLITSIKVETYQKYPKQVSPNPIPKSQL